MGDFTHAGARSNWVALPKTAGVSARTVIGRTQTQEMGEADVAGESRR